MVSHYKKGYRAENELQHKLSKMGWCVIRAPGSGKISLPSPDLIAAKKGEIIVIECKSVKNAFRIENDQLNQLKKWEKIGGAKAYIAWKISRGGWKFFFLSDVCENQGRMNKKLIQDKAFDIGKLS